jgi:hypothetical protein
MFGCTKNPDFFDNQHEQAGVLIALQAFFGLQGA